MLPVFYPALVYINKVVPSVVIDQALVGSVGIKVEQ